jgi:uncharacterized membrane protein
MDDKNLHWRTIIGGKEKTFDAEITEQNTDKRIAWRSRSGAPNAGVVTFHPLNANNTRIMLQMEYEPDGLVESAGDLVGVTSRRVEGDLERFKEFIESRGTETGAWRGKIQRDV